MKHIVGFSIGVVALTLLLGIALWQAMFCNDTFYGV